MLLPSFVHIIWVVRKLYKHFYEVFGDKKPVFGLTIEDNIVKCEKPHFCHFRLLFSLYVNENFTRMFKVWLQNFLLLMTFLQNQCGHLIRKNWFSRKSNIISNMQTTYCSAAHATSDWQAPVRIYSTQKYLIQFKTMFLAAHWKFDSKTKEKLKKKYKQLYDRSRRSSPGSCIFEKKIVSISPCVSKLNDLIE